MGDSLIPVNPQPISAQFGQGRWMNEWIQPGNLDVQEKYAELVKGMSSGDMIHRCLNYVTSIPYKAFISGRLQIEGRIFTQDDLWMEPDTTMLAGVANCANKTFLLTSLLRNYLDAHQVYAVLGNIHTNNIGGHAWVEVNRTMLLESTQPRITAPLDKAAVADIYEPVVYFNDVETYYVEGHTELRPISDVAVVWLQDYLLPRVLA